MSRALIPVAAASVPTYLGYYFLRDQVDRAWAYYVLQGLLLLALAECARRWAPSHVQGLLLPWAVGLCWWIEIESAQQVVCGALQWGQQVHADLCVQVVGMEFYRALAALAIAGMLTCLPNQRR